MSIFDDFEAKAEAKFADAMANLTDRQKEMKAEYPEFFAKCLRASLAINRTRPMRVRKEGNASRGTWVTGPIKSATPYRWRHAAKSLTCVFECELETTHPANKSKHMHTVYLRRLPK